MISRFLFELCIAFNEYSRERHGSPWSPREGCRLAARDVLIDYIERESLGEYTDLESPEYIPWDDGWSVDELYKVIKKIENRIKSSVIRRCRCFSRGRHCPLVLPETFGRKWRERMEKDEVYWLDLESKLGQD